MRAYVIRNKEGKYFCGFDYFTGINIFSERIIDGLNTQIPTLKQCREEIKDFDLKDCEPVKITIAEGDLEQQLADKDKEIEILKEQAEIWHKLLFDKMETQIVGVTNEKLKEIRHQVCEEIREGFSHWGYIGNHQLISKQKCLELLDQIEGKSNGNTRY